jgi:hypothetical protein
MPSIPPFDPGPRNTTTTPDSESEEPRMIGDFDGSANEFRKLYRDEAKSHDEVRINTLKEGMGRALIFVRSYSAHALISMDLVMLMLGSAGWFIFIFCYSHSIRSRQQTGPETDPHRCDRLRVSPPTTLYHPLSDFRATILNGPTGCNSFHSATCFPSIQSIGIMNQKTLTLTSVSMFSGS